jgi:hypothetical protein
MNFTPERDLRAPWVEQLALHFDVHPGAMEGQIAHEAAT